jgi:hypothetical protein
LRPAVGLVAVHAAAAAARRGKRRGSAAAACGRGDDGHPDAGWRRTNLHAGAMMVKLHRLKMERAGQLHTIKA